MTIPTKLLATTADIEIAIGRTLTVIETSHAEALALLASSAVVEESNYYHFAPGDYMISRYVKNNQLSLPSSPTSTVTEIRDIDQSTGEDTVLVLGTDYNVRGNTVYLLSPSYRDLLEIDVEVTDDVPTEIVAVIAGIVSSTMSDPNLSGSMDMNGSYAVSRISSSGKVWLSASDKNIIKKYKVPKQALVLA